MATLLASVLTQNGSDTAETFAVVQEQSGRWMGGAIMFFIASIGLMLGLPVIVVLVNGRAGARRSPRTSCWP